jgi:ribose transport system permease protein
MPRISVSRWLADYGMVLVLIVLCLVFSVLTLKKQPVTGATAGQSLGEELLYRYPAGRFVIAVPSGPDDEAFAAALEKAVSDGGAAVVGKAIGTPRDARKTLQTAEATGQTISAIAVTGTSGQWQLFESIGEDFPKLGSPPLFQPESRTWPDFLKLGNLLNIANHIVVVAIIAIGMTMVIITGGIDLSVGSVIALSAVTTGLLIERHFGGVQASTASMTAAAAVGVAVAGLVGLLNGTLVTLLKIPPFIASLGTMLIASGSAFLLTGGEEAHRIPASFVWLGRGTQYGIPNSVLLMLGLYVVAHVVMSRTVLGRHIYAVGGNSSAARLSGIRTGRVVLLVYIVCSLLAGVGGVLMASELKSGSPRYGKMYELYVIAAVVVGGTSLSGGKGTMFGTLIGALIIAVIRNGMNLLHVESYTQEVIFGVVILAAVVLDEIKNRRLSGRG